METGQFEFSSWFGSKTAAAVRERWTNLPLIGLNATEFQAMSRSAEPVFV